MVRRGTPAERSTAPIRGDGEGGRTTPWARQDRHVEGMGVGEDGALEAASFFSRLKASYRPRRVSHIW